MATPHRPAFARLPPAAAQPAAAGTYWYVKERDFEPTEPAKAGKARPKDGKAAKGPGYGASFAATEESWTGASRTRTIVNENLVFGFASAAGKKQWEEAGSPRLANPVGKFGVTGPVTSNNSFGGYSYNIGEIKVGLAAAGKLPTTVGKPGARLRKEWNGLTAQQQAATVGFADPSYAEYLFQVAGALLTGPVTPGHQVGRLRTARQDLPLDGVDQQAGDSGSLLGSPSGAAQGKGDARPAVAGRASWSYRPVRSAASTGSPSVPAAACAAFTHADQEPDQPDDEDCQRDPPQDVDGEAEPAEDYREQ